MHGPLESTVSNFPSFEAIDTRSLSFTCIHPCKGEEYRRCAHIVNRADRFAAAELKANIMLREPNADNLQQNLRRYAELCCCKQSHRNTAKKLGRFNELACKWLVELTGYPNAVLTERINASPPPRFLPYMPKWPRDDLAFALKLPLGEQDFADGTLYMVERREDPGFFKIGITKQVADLRFAFFQSSCGFEPVPVRQIRRVACVGRVERLVQAELIRYRGESTTCGNRRECRTLHSEWFEGDKDPAIHIMGEWARWMTEADPYEVSGQLKTSWVKILREVEENCLQPTCKNLVKAYERAQAQENLLISMFSELRIRRKLLLQD